MDRQTGKDGMTLNRPSEPETLRYRRTLTSLLPLPLSFRRHGHTISAETAGTDLCSAVSTDSPSVKLGESGQTPTAVPLGHAIGATSVPEMALETSQLCKSSPEGARIIQGHTSEDAGQAF